MALYFIDAVPGTGKTTLTHELRRRGEDAHDTDDECVMISKETGQIVEYENRKSDPYDWVYPTEKLHELKELSKSKNVFLLGSIDNFEDVRPLIDQYVWMEIPLDELLKRLDQRHDDYGNSDSERASIVSLHKEMEEMGHPKAFKLDATKPVEQIANSLLAHTILQPSIQSLFEESVMRIESVTNPGEVNQVYVVTTDTRKLIARINDAGELPRFKKEQWCIDQAEQVGVKGAKVLNVGSDGKHAYMLMSYVEGERADHVQVDISKTWRAVGESAKKIHSIPIKGFGENLEDITSGDLQKWRDYLDYNISSLDDQDPLVERGIITQQQSDVLSGHFKDLAQLEVQIGLSHGDLSLDNIIVDSNGEVNVIDWGSAEGHLVPHYDLGVILDDSLSDDSDEFAQVIAGYGLSAGEYDAIKEQVTSLMLLIATDKVRYAIDRSPESLDAAIARLKKVLLRAGSN